MTQEYYLFLDESGDFDTDLCKKYRNECIVGGFLINKDRLPTEYEVDNRLIKVWKDCFPEQKADTRNAILDRLHHATELVRDSKARPVYAILQEIASWGEFIIFENFQKSRVIDSTLTYCNILAEGVFQLLARLALENVGKRIKLNVVAGYRRDMTKEEKSYISLETVKTRIEERLRLLEIRNGSIASLGANYSFEFENDKRNSYLIVCDYICHFYFKRNDEIYKAPFETNGKDMYDELIQHYRSESIYSLQGDAEQERIVQGVTLEAFGSLLFEAGCGLIQKEKNRENIIKAFCVLSEKSRRIHLQTYSNYCKEVIENRRDLELGKMLLDFGKIIISKLNAEGKEDTVFSMDILLYRLAIENHNGNLAAMEDLFGQAQAVLSKIILYSDNIDYVFMFYNRYAVFLIDSMDVLNAYKLLDATIKEFEAYELLGEGLLSQNILNMSIGADKTAQRATQKGRLLGTQVQAAAYLFKRGEITYEDAADISNRAIENFSIYADKQRQYQYRAELEGYASHYEQSYEYLMMGLGISKISQLSSLRKLNAFELYHLSSFWSAFAEHNTKEIEYIKKLFKNDEDVLFREPGYPYFLSQRNVARALEKDSQMSSEKIKKYFKIARTTDNGEPVLLHVLKMMVSCEYVNYLMSVNDREAEEVMLDITKQCDVLLEESLPTKIRMLIGEFKESSDVNRYINLAKLSLY